MTALGAWLRRLHLAAAFLTVLPGPRQEATEAELVASVPFYPAVGLGLGMVLAGAATLARPLLPPEVLGWVLAALGAGLTRGLHWDGLADVADAWGAGAQGERFWAILKDSRTGAFGVLAVVLAAGTQASALAALLAQGRLAPMVLAPVIGRLACLALAHLASGLARPGLGALTLQGASPGLAGTLAATAVATALLLPPDRLLAVAVAVAGAVGLLLRLGHRHRGVNGDFLGAAIVLAETLVLALA